MKLASHNTFSYLPVRQWYLRPFAFMARCQRKNVAKQEGLGVRLFDIRLRFDKLKNPIICHGLIEYKHHVDFVWEWIHILNVKGNYMRIVLETKKPDAFQEECFREFCQAIEKIYTNIKFFGGNNRTDWDCYNPIYKFKNKLEDIDHKYSSTTSLFPDKFKWLIRIDDLCPKLYALLHNKKNVKEGTTHKWLMIDFVDIQ